MATTEELKQIINDFPKTKLSEENMNKLFGFMTEEVYKTDELIIKEGTVNENIYIVKDGIARGVSNRGTDKETTNYFSLAGDYAMSFHCFVFGLPSVVSFEACSQTTVMKLSKEAFESLCKESVEFSNWVIENFQGQLFALERRRVLLSGDAYERYTTLVENRTEIIRNVPLKYIASYLGITPQTLSRIRNPNYRKN